MAAACHLHHDLPVMKSCKPDSDSRHVSCCCRDSIAPVMGLAGRYKLATCGACSADWAKDAPLLLASGPQPSKHKLTSSDRRTATTQQSAVSNLVTVLHPCAAGSMDDAVRLLQQGCDALDIPPAAAKELVRFLLLKKFVEDENGSDLSCSHTLDELWHWMLLETAVRDIVYKLTGKIYHTQASAMRQGFLDIVLVSNEKQWQACERINDALDHHNITKFLKQEA